MKETQLHQPDQVAEVRQVQHKKQDNFIGSMIPGDGHKLFEFNKKTYTLQIVQKEELEKKVARFPSKRAKSNIPALIENSGIRAQNLNFKTKENCLYLYALNFKSAAKKLVKRYNVPYVLTIEDEQPTTQSN